MSNSSKYKVSFRYSSSQSPSETNDAISVVNSASRLTYLTYNSAFTLSSKSTKRVNQLPPKKKVNLNHKPKTAEKKK